MRSDEVLWVEQARNGDAEAFSRLVKAYEVPVYNLAYRMLGAGGDAEEATQETFVRVYTKLHTYRPTCKLSSWVLSIAAHYCVDRLRRRRIVPISLDENPPAAEVRSRHPQPDEVVLRREVQDEVQGLVEQLAPEYRVPIILRYWHDLSYAEIAEVMGLTVQAVKTRLHRARLQIADRAQQGVPSMAVAVGVR